MRALYAFGSREAEAWRLLAGGTARGASDIDFAVRWFPPISTRFERRGALETWLYRRLPGLQVDLVEIDHQRAFFAGRALRGERLYAADDREADAHEELIWAMEGDLADLERWSWRETREKLLEWADR